MSKAAAADSAATTGTVVLIGPLADSEALAALCSKGGIPCASFEVSPDGSVSVAARDALADSSIVIDARSQLGGASSASLAEVEAAVPAATPIIAVTSHAAVSSLGKGLKRPGSFAGLVLPAGFESASTIEIARLDATTDETVAKVAGFLTRVGKRSIVVADSAGFFVGRVSGSYLNEAMALVGEGIPAAVVEDAALDCGMQAGPLAELDRVSLKLSDELLHQELHDLEHAQGTRAQSDGGAGTEAHRDEHHDHAHHSAGSEHEDDDHGHHHDHGHVHDHDHDHGQDHDHDHDHGHGQPDQAKPHQHAPAHAAPRQPAGSKTAAAPKAAAHKHSHKVKSKRMPEPAVYVMEKMAHGFRRMGRDSGAGFYDYEDDGTVTLWSGLKAFERRSANVPADDIRDRMLFIQALETARCLEEGIVGSTTDADDASVGACGFPSASGGTVQFIEKVGLAGFVQRAQELAARYGERFQPSARLLDLATRGGDLSSLAAGTRHSRQA